MGKKFSRVSSPRSPVREVADPNGLCFLVGEHNRPRGTHRPSRPVPSRRSGQLGRPAVAAGVHRKKRSARRHLCTKHAATNTDQVPSKPRLTSPNARPVILLGQDQNPHTPDTTLRWSAASSRARQPTGTPADRAIVNHMNTCLAQVCHVSVPESPIGHRSVASLLHPKSSRFGLLESGQQWLAITGWWR